MGYFCKKVFTGRSEAEGLGTDHGVETKFCRFLTL